MTIEVKVPALPESVADAVVLTWHKKPGDLVKRDESLVDVETDKVVLEVPAPVDGVLSDITQQEGATVVSDQVLAVMQEGNVSEQAAAEEAVTSKESNDEKAAPVISPSAKKMLIENDIDEKSVTGTGRDGRILKEDIINYLSQQKKIKSNKVESVTAESKKPVETGERIEKRVPMTRLRARIAERLVDAQQSAAILTTFNEVNMKPVMDLRKKYQDKFEKEYDVRLGFMSFFIKATIEALKQFPAVNASIDGNDIVYHGFFDMGVAVSSPRGLVVPVIRDADQMNLAEIEKAINVYVEKAKNNAIGIEEMTGGTFTISNGGVFGSLLSTPILNPPQSAILGMHKIQERAVVENGEIVIRPIMYLALSYDHRIIDGREAVQFLVTIKDCLEDPARMIIGV
ncbi:MAG: 2-oxoglutarate dehydrogenase complex dihydrolipoyllysine-residue succinyltransferase [Gammaproteobacteria bacterium]|nr:2-oxoglutarate dehydrogenase complex dihydrolipoyllysine-residue succinyltransferase [Gammaproteobacteria bacterium]MCW9004283.1 2-oxoglutarate dehydrogenase complex dihydrolipoyllysine-residue succinyltransferase [Gammaproteobacteria bacterium]MCW9055551.1 2-oxoglutarate dehydrogenase complex dihydrolipoyllysine-residue succinyltransferase [Gammaproteobacteria bacterium]